VSSPGPGYFADLREGKMPEKSSPPSKPYRSPGPLVEGRTQEDEMLAGLILAALPGIRRGRVPGGLYPGKLPGV
jgi:hypothetical protein